MPKKKKKTMTKARRAKRLTRLKKAYKKIFASTSKKNFSRKDLKLFKGLILKKKESILDEIKHISEDTIKQSQRDAAGDISSYTYHMADVATDTYDREFSLGLASNERKLLYDIDDALKRIEEGAYGICESCKRAISKTRLKAVPYAKLCINCQEKQETV